MIARWGIGDVEPVRKMTEKRSCQVNMRSCNFFGDVIKQLCGGGTRGTRLEGKGGIGSGYRQLRPKQTQTHVPCTRIIAPSIGRPFLGKISTPLHPACACADLIPQHSRGTSNDIATAPIEFPATPCPQHRNNRKNEIA